LTTLSNCSNFEKKKNNKKYANFVIVYGLNGRVKHTRVRGVSHGGNNDSRKPDSETHCRRISDERTEEKLNRFGEKRRVQVCHISAYTPTHIL